MASWKYLLLIPVIAVAAVAAMLVLDRDDDDLADELGRKEEPLVVGGPVGTQPPTGEELQRLQANARECSVVFADGRDTEEVLAENHEKGCNDDGKWVNVTIVAYASETDFEAQTVTTCYYHTDPKSNWGYGLVNGEWVQDRDFDAETHVPEICQREGP